MERRRPREEGDGKNEVEEGLEREGNAADPEAAGAGEEDLRDEAVEDEDEEDELEGGADDLGKAGDVDELREEGGVGVEAEAGEKGDGGEGKQAEDGGGECDGLAAEAEAGFGELLPGVDVVLVFAGEELAHLGVDAVYVGGQRKDGEEDG